MSSAFNRLPPAPSVFSRARAYATRASIIGSTMLRYGILRRPAGVRNGARAFGQLAQEISNVISGRKGDRICTLCGWSGDRFGPVYYFDTYREDVLCYGCGSTDRVRLLPLYCHDKLAAFFSESRKRVLDIGPARNSRLFFPENVDYVSFDLYAPHAMVRGDICEAPFSYASFDLWVCFHVLDLIEDDEKAMRELFRVLAPGGIGLLDNAMNWNGPTQEYGHARPEEAMHRRRYGTDLPDKLRKIGFDVDVVDVEQEFDAETRERVGIHPRKILICKKPLTT